MSDLNQLIPANSSLALMLACSITSRGEIVGLAFQPSTGEFHAYVAVPNNEANATVSAEAKSAGVAAREDGGRLVRGWLGVRGR